MHKLEEAYLKEGKEAVKEMLANFEVGFNPYRYEVEKATVIGKEKNTYEILLSEYALENNTSETPLGYHYARVEDVNGEEIKVAKYLVTISMNEITLKSSPTLNTFVGRFNNSVDRQFIYSIKEMADEEVTEYYNYDEFVSAEDYFEESAPVEETYPDVDLNTLFSQAASEDAGDYIYNDYDHQQFEQQQPDYSDQVIFFDDYEG